MAAGRGAALILVERGAIMRNDDTRARNFNIAGIGFSRCMRGLLAMWMLLALSGLVACGGRAPSAASSPTAPPLADELIFYNWGDYMPQSVLDAFTAEYGVKVTYQTYDSTEEAATQLRAGRR